MGIWLANMKNVPVEDILDFKESLSILLISGLFILLAARLDFSLFQTIGWAALWLFVFIQVFARPIKVWLSTLGSDLKWQERVMIAWIGPRGIVAAAVTALFAIKLQEIGVEEAKLLVPLAFSIIIGTVVLQGATSKFLAQRLGVAEPEDNGFLIVGANPVARLISKALKDSGFTSLVADASWTNIKAARMEGLSTYYGNAVSEHADRHLDLIGIGHLLALTPQKERNALAGRRYQSEFGANKIYLLPSEEQKDTDRDQQSRKSVRHQYHLLFGKELHYSKLASWIGQGAKTKHTTLSESFSFSDYKAQYENRAIPLFMFNTKRQLRFFTSDSEHKPEAGWTIVALVKEELAG
jgi:CPA1 family monovalent cation:H+ antiporter